MKSTITLIVALCAAALAQAQEPAPPQSGEVEICGLPLGGQVTVTINPEVRVSVVQGSETPPAAGPDGVIELRVQIINNGFLTSPLEARLVGLIPEGAAIEFSPQPLTGAHEEMRILRIHLAKPGLADVTVSFRPKNESADLGGRDRVHFLLHR
jgi:hypothetical protein